MLRCLGSILIFSGFIYAGVYYCNRLKMKEKIIKEIIMILEILISNIDYSVIALTDIFEKIELSDLCAPTKRMIKNVVEKLKESDIETFGTIWTKQTDLELGAFLDEKEKILIKDIGLIENHVDKNSQVLVLKRVREELIRLSNNYSNEFKGKIKTYMVSFASFGIILIITLI